MKASCAHLSLKRALTEFGEHPGAWLPTFCVYVLGRERDRNTFNPYAAELTAFWQAEYIWEGT